jgi:methylamine dehydrogenase accessory protein MauD
VLTASVIALWVLVLGLTVLVMLLYRQFGLLYVGSSGRVAMSGLEIGAKAPTGLTAAVDGANKALDWAAAGRGRSTLIIFGGPGCPLCARLTPTLAEFADGWRWAVDVWFIERGLDDIEVSGKTVDTSDLWMYAVSVGGKVHDAFDIEVNPFAFVVSHEGMVTAKGLVRTSEELAHLVETARGESGSGVARPTNSATLEVTHAGPR